MTFLVREKVVFSIFRGSMHSMIPRSSQNVLHAAQYAFASQHALLIEAYREVSNVCSLWYSVTNTITDLEAFNYRIAAAQYSNSGSMVVHTSDSKTKSKLLCSCGWKAQKRFSIPSCVYPCIQTMPNASHICCSNPPSGLNFEVGHDVIKTEVAPIRVDVTFCALRSRDVICAMEMFEHLGGLEALGGLLGPSRLVCEPRLTLRAYVPGGQNFGQ